MNKEQKQNKILMLGNEWYGNFSLSLYWNLQKMGIDCNHIKMNHEWKPNRFLNKIEQLLFIRKLNRRIANEINKNDLSAIVVIAGYNILPQTYELIKSKKIPIIAWIGDDPFKKTDIFKNFCYFSKVFLVDQDWTNLTKYLYPKAEFLPHAADPEVFYPISPKRKYENDIVFIGSSYHSSPDGLLRAEILKTLFENGFNIKLYGDNGWKKLFPKYPFLEKIFMNKMVGPKELNELYNSTKIVLNIQHSELKSGTNQRTFEIACAGAFQLVDYQKPIDELFKGNIVTFNSSLDLVEKAKYYLTREEERNKLAEKAREIVINNHTYRHRIKKLLNE